MIGRSPPVAIVWIAPPGSISEIVFDPAFRAAIPMPEPSKLPRNSPLGAWPTA